MILSYSLQRDSVGLSNQNNELKFRLQAMEQQAQLRDGMYQLLLGLMVHILNHSVHCRKQAFHHICLITGGVIVASLIEIPSLICNVSKLDYFVHENFVVLILKNSFSYIGVGFDLLDKAIAVQRFKSF